MRPYWQCWVAVMPYEQCRVAVMLLRDKYKGGVGASRPRHPCIYPVGCTGRGAATPRTTHGIRSLGRALPTPGSYLWGAARARVLVVGRRPRKGPIWG